MAVHTSQWQSLLDRIDREELVELALALANIDSPPGREKPVSDYICDWLRRESFEARQLGLVPERPNVVGRLRGAGGGLNLIFNAHMDTAWGPEERRWMHEPDPPFTPRAGARVRRWRRTAW